MRITTHSELFDLLRAAADHLGSVVVTSWHTFGAQFPMYPDSPRATVVVNTMDETGRAHVLKFRTCGRRRVWVIVHADHAELASTVVRHGKGQFVRLPNGIYDRTRARRGVSRPHVGATVRMWEG